MNKEKRAQVENKAESEGGSRAVTIVSSTSAFDDADLGSTRPIRRCPECDYFERGRRVIETNRSGFGVKTALTSRIVWSGAHCPVDGNPLEEICKCGAYLVSPADVYCRSCGKAYWWLAQTGQVDVGVTTWQIPDNELETIAGIHIYAVQGSLTRVEADAIISSDNAHGLMTSRSARAIRREGGEEIEAESAAFPRHLGEAWVTKGGKLHVRTVIHVAVLNANSGTDADIIESALRNALRVANEQRLKTIALPPLGTGLSGFPLEDSIRLSREAIRSQAHENQSLSGIAFVLFTPDGYNAFRAAYRTALRQEAAADGSEEGKPTKAEEGVGGVA